MTTTYDGLAIEPNGPFIKAVESLEVKLQAERNTVKALEFHIRDLLSQRAGLAQKCAEQHTKIKTMEHERDQDPRHLGVALALDVMFNDRLDKIEEMLGGMAGYTGYADFVAG